MIPYHLVMTQMILIVLTGLVSIYATPSNAADFSQYKTPVEEMTCKKLDFSSYFKAQEAEKSILHDHPELTRPNFAGKFLLVKNELLMETRWFIADCKTGKFLKKTLFGEADFKPDSALVILSEPKPKEHQPAVPPQYQVWTGEEWTKTEGATSAPANASVTTKSATASSAPSSTLEQYEKLFSSYLSEVPAQVAPCKALNYDSYFRAQANKAKLVELSTALQHPNFAGKYILLKTESMFETLWLIANCETGLFYQETIKGDAKFKPISNLMVVYSSDEFPSLMTWNENQWVKIADPIQNKTQKILNTLSFKSSKTIFEALPNSEHQQTLRFTDLFCTPTMACTVKIDHGKSTDLKQIEPTRTPEVLKILKIWGAQRPSGYKVHSGQCMSGQDHFTCKFVTQAEDQT